ncbi:MAG: threonylcarbamoyl-AMP synthase [Thermodesulfobacteria bacterium]|nr:threonylcarbamoyl-AMP synthase [Thermodesulfobacteriota bacterium]
MVQQVVTAQEDDGLDEAARVIKEGGVCVIPTETAYGLAASIYNPRAMSRIYEIKRRPTTKPLLILADDLKEAPVELSAIPRYAMRLMDRFWPGPLTLLLPASSEAHFYLTGGSKKVGVRLSSHPVAAELVRRVGHPITATSANLSGMGLSKTIQQVREQLDGPAVPDIFLDAGKIDDGPASTIVDCTGQRPKIVREGAISREDILALG